MTTLTVTHPAWCSPDEDDLSDLENGGTYGVHRGPSHTLTLDEGGAQITLRILGSLSAAGEPSPRDPVPQIALYGEGYLTPGEALWLARALERLVREISQ